MGVNMDLLVYDIEIIKAIPDRYGEPIKGVEYCAGWEDHANMGVAVVGAWDGAVNRYRVFCGDNLAEFGKLCETHFPLVSFNGLRFDNVVLGHHGINILDGRCYDILDDIWRAIGGFTKGYGLDPCCAANFGTRKTGNGALAPVLWQQGKIGEVIDYCLNDVAMTKRLFERIASVGTIIDPTNGNTLSLPGPSFLQ